MKKINKFIKWIKGYYIHSKYGKNLRIHNKVIIIEPVESKFNRYLYPFFYMLSSNGFKPVLNVKKHDLLQMYYDKYQRLIFKNGLYFKYTRKMNVIKKIVIDTDYFSALLINKKREKIVPMCMHPLIYAKNVKPFKNNKANRIAFFAGTISAIHHNKTQIFKGVISRYKIVQFLKNLDNTIYVNNKSNIENVYNSHSKSHFLIYDTKTINLTPSDLFKELSRSSFFLALPGRGMPLSHNIIEAMCCNCIPILQDIYANMFPVPLEDNVNCLIYKDKDELKQVSDRVNQFNLEKIDQMRTNVNSYYNKYLSSKAITNLITKTENTHFYLQAEGRSIILYKHNKLEKNII